MHRLVVRLALFLIAFVAAAPAAFAQRVEVRGPANLEVQAAGGVYTFAGANPTETDPGAAWAVRAILLPDAPLALEFGYLGAINPLEAIDASVLTTNLHSMLRLNLARMLGARLLAEPYFGAGLGFTNHEVTGGFLEEGPNNGSALELPVAAGVVIPVTGEIAVDARLGYHFLYNAPVIGDGRNVDVFAATAGVGYTF